MKDATAAAVIASAAELLGELAPVDATGHLDGREAVANTCAAIGACRWRDGDPAGAQGGRSLNNVARRTFGMRQSGNARRWFTHDLVHRTTMIQPGLELPRTGGVKSRGCQHE